MNYKIRSKMKRLALLISAVMAVVMTLGLVAEAPPALAHGSCTTTAIFVYVSTPDGTEGQGKGKIECDVNHPEMHLIIDFQRRTGPNDSWSTIDEHTYECDNTDSCIKFPLGSSFPLCIGKQYRAHVEGWVWSGADGKHHDDTDNTPVVDGGHHC
jgi:hypothetical protein